MMVKSSYFYDITLTMNTETFSESWTVCPDQKYKQEGKFKSFEVRSVSIDLPPHQRGKDQYPLNITSDRMDRLVGRGCPIELFHLLINSMMNIPAKITRDHFGKFRVVVKTFNHMKHYIDEAITTMIERSFFTDLSFDDAREIISRLKIEEFIYCFEGHESGVCLVVLGPNDRARNQYEQPWYLFQQEVQKFNESRTIFMTCEQEERLVTCNEDFHPLVEFTSSVNKTTRKVVFKKQDSKVEIIRQTLDVEKLAEQLSIATVKLQGMLQFEETLDLKRRMFPSE
jgi:hypothetical protein